jgi:hypothetical protein
MEASKKVMVYVMRINEVVRCLSSKNTTFRITHQICLVYGKVEREGNAEASPTQRVRAQESAISYHCDIAFSCLKIDTSYTGRGTNV